MGSWEMYGVEDDKRYPNLQAEFFERAAGPLTRREAIYSFLAVCALTTLSPISETFHKPVNVPEYSLSGGAATEKYIGRSVILCLANASDGHTMGQC